MDITRNVSVLLDAGNFTPKTETPDPVCLESIVRYRSSVAIEMIREDILRGVHSPDISAFSELHEAVDANMYLIDEQHPDPLAGSFSDWPDLTVNNQCVLLNRIIEAAEDWLKTRALVRHREEY